MHNATARQAVDILLFLVLVMKLATLVTFITNNFMLLFDAVFKGNRT